MTDYKGVIVKFLEKYPDEKFTAPQITERVTIKHLAATQALAVRWQLLVLGLTGQIGCSIDETRIETPVPFTKRFDETLLWFHSDDSMPF